MWILEKLNEVDDWVNAKDLGWQELTV